jgi:hypothetical protein
MRKKGGKWDFQPCHCGIVAFHISLHQPDGKRVNLCIFTQVEAVALVDRAIERKVIPRKERGRIIARARQLGIPSQSDLVTTMMSHMMISSRPSSTGHDDLFLHIV